MGQNGIIVMSIELSIPWYHSISIIVPSSQYSVICLGWSNTFASYWYSLVEVCNVSSPENVWMTGNTRRGWRGSLEWMGRFTGHGKISKLEHSFVCPIGVLFPRVPFRLIAKYVSFRSSIFGPVNGESKSWTKWKSGWATQSGFRNCGIETFLKIS